MKRIFITLLLILVLIITLPVSAVELEFSGQSITYFGTGSLEVNGGDGNTEEWAGDNKYFDAADPFKENSGVAYKGFGLNYGFAGVPWEGYKFDTQEDLRDFKTDLLLNIKTKDDNFLNIDLKIDSTANLLDDDDNDEELAEYLVSLNENGWNLKFGNKLNPNLNPYIMGTVVDDNDNFSIVNLEGLELSKNLAGINFRTIAAREERSDFYQDTFLGDGYLGYFGLTGDIDEDAFDSYDRKKAAETKANYYGVKAEKAFVNGIYLAATAVQKTDKTDYENYTYFDGIKSRDNSQNNLGLNFVYTGLKNFSFIGDYATVNYDSSFADTRPNAGHLAFGQDDDENSFSQFIATTTAIPNAEITALYKNTEENYLAARTNPYILDSVWPTGIFGYRKGYEISGTYNFPFAFNPVLNLSYSDMDWTRTQANDREDDNEELMSSSLALAAGPLSTTIAYSSSNKTNDSFGVEMLTDQARQQAQSGPGMDNYGDLNGYRGAHEWKKDVSSISAAYALIKNEKSSLNLKGGYTVNDYEGNDTVKDATNPKISDSVKMKEKIKKIGISGSRKLSQKTTLKMGYDYEDRELNDLYGVEGTASLGTFTLGADYIISESKSFSLEYKNLNYDENNNNDNLTDPAYNTYPNSAREGAARTQYFNDDYNVHQITGVFTVNF